MKQKQKGYTLLEMIIVLLLLSIVSLPVMLSTRKLEDMALQIKAKEVVALIEYAKQAAATTGEQYNICCFENRVIVKKGMDSAVYKVYLEDNQYIPLGATKYDSIQTMYFKGKMATGEVGKIYIRNVSLGKEAIITVGVATGKVRVYYEPI